MYLEADRTFGSASSPLQVPQSFSSAEACLGSVQLLISRTSHVLWHPDGRDSAWQLTATFDPCFGLRVESLLHPIPTRTGFIAEIDSGSGLVRCLEGQISASDVRAILRLFRQLRSH